MESSVDHWTGAFRCLSAKVDPVVVILFVVFFLRFFLLASVFVDLALVPFFLALVSLPLILSFAGANQGIRVTSTIHFSPSTLPK